MLPTQTLPAGYQKIGTLDLSKDRRLLIALNVLGILATIFFGWLFLRALILLRPAGSIGGTIGFSISGLPRILGIAAGVLALMVFYVTLHEAIHGLFFWLFTRTRPKFAFRWTYAYAAAPDWYIPRNAYLIIALAPLLVISLAGLAIMPLVPAGWVLPLWFVLTMNAGGAIGDIAVAAWLLRLPPTTLSQDRGNSVTLFRPEV